MIWPLLEARAEIQKHLCSFFGSNENFKIFFWDLLTLRGKDSNGSRCLLYYPWHLFQWYVEFWISNSTYYWSMIFVWQIRNLSSQLKVSTNIFIKNIQYSKFSILPNHHKSCQGHKISYTQYFFDLSFTNFQIDYQKTDNFRKHNVSKFEVIKKCHYKNS